jgi:hypothetical protein
LLLSGPAAQPLLEVAAPDAHAAAGEPHHGEPFACAAPLIEGGPGYPQPGGDLADGEHIIVGCGTARVMTVLGLPSGVGTAMAGHSGFVARSSEQSGWWLMIEVAGEGIT